MISQLSLTYFNDKIYFSCFFFFFQVVPIRVVDDTTTATAATAAAATTTMGNFGRDGMVSAAVSRLVACGLLQPGQGMNDVVVASLTLNEKLLRVTNLFKMLMAVVGRNEVTGEVEALMLGVEIVHRCLEKEQQEEKICMKVDLKETIVLLFYLLDALTNLFSFFFLLLSSSFSCKRHTEQSWKQGNKIGGAVTG